MTQIWLSDRNNILAAFLTREEERRGYKVYSVTNLPGRSVELEKLEQNRLAVSEYFKRPALQLCMGKQVHSAHVAYCSGTGIHDQTDALVTDKTGLALAVLVADCSAVLIADPVHKVISAIHAGWRGAIGGIITNAVDKMIHLGSEPDVMQAYISCCISLESFEVGEEVASRFPAAYVDRSRVKPHVDLGGFVVHELQKSGISSESIIRDDRCTVLHPESFHSHRRDGSGSGRMMGVIALD